MLAPEAFAPVPGALGKARLDHGDPVRPGAPESATRSRRHGVMLCPRSPSRARGDDGGHARSCPADCIGPSPTCPP